jgi:hypothetical protein
MRKLEMGIQRGSEAQGRGLVTRLAASYAISDAQGEMLWTTGDKTQQTGTDVSVVSGPFAPYAISTFLMNAAMAWAAAPGFVYRAK